MELEELIKNLQEYIDLDRKMRTSPIEEWSDFDKFCELHCRDIEKALKYIKEESIPRAVVEEKIEEVKKLAEKSDCENLIACELDIRKNQLYLLENLLIKGE